MSLKLSASTEMQRFREKNPPHLDFCRKNSLHAPVTCLRVAVCGLAPVAEDRSHLQTDGLCATWTLLHRWVRLVLSFCAYHARTWAPVCAQFGHCSSVGPKKLIFNPKTGGPDSPVLLSLGHALFSRTDFFFQLLRQKSCLFQRSERGAAARALVHARTHPFQTGKVDRWVKCETFYGF